MHSMCQWGRKLPKSPVPLGIWSPCRRRTKPRPRATCAKNLGKDHACRSWDIFSDRQTHTQTRSSQYFVTTPAGEVIITAIVFNDIDLTKHCCLLLTQHIHLLKQVTDCSWYSDGNKLYDDVARFLPFWGEPHLIINYLFCYQFRLLLHFKALLPIIAALFFSIKPCIIMHGCAKNLVLPVKQGVALMGRNTSGQPWSVGCARARPSHPPAVLQTPAIKTNNTGPLGGPVKPSKYFIS